MVNDDYINIKGARMHNLKNLNLRIRKNTITAITGVSGSGKSSLAFDLLFEEGRLRYLQAIGLPPRIISEKQFDEISGLSPTVAVEQRTVRFRNPRSTVGTRTGIYNYLRMFFASEAWVLCPKCKARTKGNICSKCKTHLKQLEIKHFSFNEPSGMCSHCAGRGYVREFKVDKIVPDSEKTLYEICAAARTVFADMRTFIHSLARHYNFDADTPYSKLSQEIKHIFLYGSGDEEIEFELKSKNYIHKTRRPFEGVIPHMERALERGISSHRHRKIEEIYMEKVICPECGGYRLNKNSLQCTLAGKNIGELACLSIEELIEFIEAIDNKHFQYKNSLALKEKLLYDLNCFDLVGLKYLHLNRGTLTLSSGENQRLSLLAQLNLGLDDVILIFDEPTMGMHEKEKWELYVLLKKIKRLGNTIIVVEHDEELIELADEIIDLGPGAGSQGGELVFQGDLKQIKQQDKSLTGKYLAKTLKHPQSNSSFNPAQHKDWLEITGACTNNLKNISVRIPLGIITGICGRSGSGKSSLIIDTLVPLLEKRLKQKETSVPLKIQSCIVVDQSPIGRNRNSFPASYIDLWYYIRKLYSKQLLARKRGYTEGHFSFNSEKGQCPHCRGNGKITVSISYLDEISTTCEECNGQRFLLEILEIKYHDRSIADILSLPVKEALSVFAEEEKVMHYLRFLADIGMDYIELGQPANTLSGGEAQRIKLCKALGDQKDENTLFILDEPSSGLHFHDEVKLLHLLERLKTQGNSIIIIEHNINILKFCDWLIELGPRGGPHGGEVIAEGNVNSIKSCAKSVIKEFI